MLTRMMKMTKMTNSQRSPLQPATGQREAHVRVAFNKPHGLAVEIGSTAWGFLGSGKAYSRYPHAAGGFPFSCAAVTNQGGGLVKLFTSFCLTARMFPLYTRTW